MIIDCLISMIYNVSFLVLVHKKHLVSFRWFELTYFLNILSDNVSDQNVDKNMTAFSVIRS